ncbi:protein phosphatase 2C domain-containing protein [Streptacidiphilus sp. PB12-B1b]|uniref:protein phosphatase 2C domain-containing protein n=1 Tax=Streptacidiphilus sp. PB12-B1b TaxID=2705012 RepID=UPI0015FE2486|nr:protein phosphatase 2C domain-containing protein [Streptacidiphilus sp. PB12-B1b]QMU74569.1 protein phosphatase 2C domain-containing protein [Streptacidiphilus sp. PB12-B1b]
MDDWGNVLNPPPPVVPPPSAAAGGGPEGFPRRAEIGVPSTVFEARPPGAASLSYRPDTIVDGWSTHAFTVRMASVRGDRHRYGDRPREDDVALAVDPRTGALVFAVADGVSKARQPHLGATLACRTAVDTVVAQLDGGRAHADIDLPQVLSAGAYALRDHASRVLERTAAGSVGIDETAHLLATTLVAGLVTPTPDGLQVSLVRIGDSNAWVLRGEVYEPIWEQPPPGDQEVASSAVHPLPYVSSGIRPRGFVLPDRGVLLVGTDGFGGPLGDGTGQVGRLFAERLAAPPPPLEFAHLLDFSRETFDDDRTLLAVWQRRQHSGGGT